MKVASFFAGAGGLDLGFRKAGFDVVWANEYDKSIHATYERNHKGTILDRRSINDVVPSDLPKGIDGMIGGPPCQSWSEAGMLRRLLLVRWSLLRPCGRIHARRGREWRRCRWACWFSCVVGQEK